MSQPKSSKINGPSAKGRLRGPYQVLKAQSTYCPTNRPIRSPRSPPIRFQETRPKPWDPHTRHANATLDCPTCQSHVPISKLATSPTPSRCRTGGDLVRWYLLRWLASATAISSCSSPPSPPPPPRSSRAPPRSARSCSSSPVTTSSRTPPARIPPSHQPTPTPTSGTTSTTSPPPPTPSSPRPPGSPSSTPPAPPLRATSRTRRPMRSSSLACGRCSPRPRRGMTRRSPPQRRRSRPQLRGGTPARSPLSRSSPAQGWRARRPARAPSCFTNSPPTQETSSLRWLSPTPSSARRWDDSILC